MTTRRNFEEFHKSIAKELAATQDRIRNLIGDTHWLTDGEHKEAALRKILRNHIPDLYHVGNGFISLKSGTSNQIDILITDKNHPTLFRDGQLRIVTPDSVRAIIEVKTKIDSLKKLSEILVKIADNVEKIRTENKLYNCWAGLFAYSSGRVTHEDVLLTLADTAKNEQERTINCIALGQDNFFRFWQRGRDVSSPVDGPVWHSYELRELSFAYFLGNVVFDLSWERAMKSKYAWFPIEGGKEKKRKYYIGIGDRQINDFGKE